MSQEHIAILILAALIGFNAGLLAIRWWHYWIWKKTIKRRD